MYFWGFIRLLVLQSLNATKNMNETVVLFVLHCGIWFDICFFFLAVLEEATSSNTEVSKKASILTKLPQRVRNTPVVMGSSSSDEEGGSVQPGQEKTTGRTRAQRAVSRKAVESAVGNVAVGKNMVSKSPSQSRRETFVVSKDVELPSSGSVEDIASMPMPDLVSASPMKDEEMTEVFESSQQAPEQPVQAAELPEQSSRDEISNKNKAPATKTKGSAAAVSSKDRRKSGSKNIGGAAPAVSVKDRRKSGGKNPEGASGKTTKGAASKVLTPVTPSLQKDTGFFISNPCALNLVHKRVTGSSEGCLDSNTDAGAKPVSTVDLFVAEIKESNRKSAKIASFISADDPSNVQKPRRSAEKPSGIVQKCPRSLDAAPVPESDKPDQTMFFDTDMDFTEVLPQTRSLESLADLQGGADKPHTATGSEAEAHFKRGADEVLPVGTETTAHSKGKGKDATDKQEGRKRTRTKSGRRPILGKGEEVARGDAERECEQTGSGESRKLAREAAARTEEMESELTGLGEDKKLAVALRVNKPGQMVFAAARKEDDGSRKAIPAKLHAKARSKSKKQIEEMMKNLPQKEPESIFDFHDRTPRPVVMNGDATKQPSSVFDLSLNDTAPGIAPSLTTFREKKNVVTKGKKVDGPESAAEAEHTEKVGKHRVSQSGDADERGIPSLLGDAPIYRLPLKDDNSSPSEPRSQSRGRSASKGREPTRQSRSKSRSRKNAQEEAEENFDCDSQNHRGRSKSRTRSETKLANNETGAAEDLRKNREPGDGSGGRKSKEEEDVHQEEDKSEGPRRSTRSKSKVRKTYTDDSEENLFDSSLEKETDEGKSRCKIRKDDEDDEYKPTKTMEKAEQRGRSRQRKQDSDKDRKNGDAEEPETKTVEQRGRSRSRRRVEMNNSSEREAGQDTVSKDHNSTGGTEPESETKDSKTTPARHLTASGIKAVHDKPQDSTGSPSTVKRLTGLRTKAVLDKPQCSEEDSATAECLTGSSNKTVSDKSKGGKDSSSPADSDSGAAPVMMVTDRRHRSKSSHRKLYKQPDNSSDPFGSSFDPVEGCLGSQTATMADEKGVEKKTRHRTRSRGTILQKHKEERPSQNSPKADDSSTSPGTNSQMHLEKRKSADGQSENHSTDGSERENSPTKKLCTDRDKIKKDSMNSADAAKDSDNFEKKVERDGASQRKMLHADETGIASDSPASKTKRKSSLPIPVAPVVEESETACHTPATARARSKKGTKIPEPTSAGKVGEIIIDLGRKPKVMKCSVAGVRILLNNY